MPARSSRPLRTRPCAARRSTAPARQRCPVVLRRHAMGRACARRCFAPAATPDVAAPATAARCLPHARPLARIRSRPSSAAYRRRLAAAQWLDRGRPLRCRRPSWPPSGPRRRAPSARLLRGAGIAAAGGVCRAAEPCSAGAPAAGGIADAGRRAAAIDSFAKTLAAAPATHWADGAPGAQPAGRPCLARNGSTFPASVISHQRTKLSYEALLCLIL